MGLFLETVLIQGKDTVTVKEYLKNIAGRRKNYDIVPEKCIISAGTAGTTVQLNEDTLGYDELAAALSKESKGAVILCYIYDGDFWGYYLYDNGREKDHFCPVPDYFGDAPDESDAGDAEILQEVFGIEVSRLENYLCFWEDIETGEKAYPEDEFCYNVWQMYDFIKALGFTVPEEDS